MPRRPQVTNLRGTSETQDLGNLSKLIKFRERKVKFRSKVNSRGGARVSLVQPVIPQATPEPTSVPLENSLMWDNHEGSGLQR